MTKNKGSDGLFGWFDDMLEDMEEWILEKLTDAVEFVLNQTHNIFSHSVDTVYDQVAQTPHDFSPNLVESLETISNAAILPVAGIILTYVFAYEIYNLVAEKNRGNDFDTQGMFYLIFKTTVVILLVTNSFTITMAFFDLGQWIMERVPSAELTISDQVTDSILEMTDGIGVAIAMLLLGFIAFLFSFVMAGIIYLVAWSRIIMILMYVSVAPLPFATLMNKDWIGSAGQNYLKQIVALMLQGFFMLIALIIYSGLLEVTSGLIGEQDQPIFGLMLMLVSMGILTLTMARTHSIAKSVVGGVM
jgi:hypothetical protein